MLRELFPEKQKLHVCVCVCAPMCFQILKREMQFRRDNHTQHFLLRTKTKAKIFMDIPKKPLWQISLEL